MLSIFHSLFVFSFVYVCAYVCADYLIHAFHFTPSHYLVHSYNVNEILTTVRECSVQFRVARRYAAFFLSCLYLCVLTYLCAYNGDGWEHMALTKGGADGSPR
jgi:hypothetical protein